MDETQTPRAVYRAIMEAVAHEYELTPEVIEGRRRLPEIVKARAMVAKRLFARGFTEQRVATIMKRHLQTVQIYLGRQRYRPPPKPEPDHGRHQE